MEVYKDIEGFEGKYQVSNFGNVRSLDRVITNVDGHKRIYPGVLMKGEITYQGYIRVMLSDGKASRRSTVHKLVAEAFIGEYPDGKVINHIDEDKSNNHYKNLEYITQKENVNHGSGIKRRAKSQRVAVRGKHMETGEVVEFESMMEAERSTNGYFHNGHISQACAGALPHHRGYKWEKV